MPEKTTYFIPNRTEKKIYKLNQFVNDSSGLDIDGDFWNSFQFVATDNNNLSVKILIVLFKSQVSIITIIYGNIQLKYQGRPPSLFDVSKKEIIVQCKNVTSPTISKYLPSVYLPVAFHT